MTLSCWWVGVEPPSGTSYAFENWLSVNRAMRKKPLREEGINENPNNKGYKTSSLVDTMLLQRAGVARPLEDREGLDRAYQQGDTYTRGSTMYVAGSHTARDWYDDITKIPFWGDVKESERYQQADKMLKANPQIRTIVGHSLGGAVAHELQREHPGLKSVTYGSPSISWGKEGGEGRFRNEYDPVSMLDLSLRHISEPTRPY